MAIAIGEKIPSFDYQVKIEGAVAFYDAEYFAGAKVVMFALPGAFTPVCTSIAGLFGKL